MAATIAANTRWANAPGAARKEQAARLLAGQDRRYARQALDPTGELTGDQIDALIASTPPGELAKRIANARKAHMTRAALASARARRKAAS